MNSHKKTVPKPSAAAKGRALDWLALGVLAVLGWFGLFRPLWYDEAYTVLNYGCRPFKFIVTNYPLPNNHIGYTLILHGWSLLLGDPTMIRPDTWVLRLPSLVLSTLGVVAFFLFVRRAVAAERPLALLATCMYACQPQVLQYAGQLRGYGPSMAWLSLALAAAVHADRLPRARFALLVGGGLFLANYTLPTNTWFTLPLALGMALLWLGQAGGMIPAAEARKPFIPARSWRFPWRDPVFLWGTGALAAAFVLTVLAYLPVRAQLARHSQMAHTLPAMARSLVTTFFAHWARLLDAVGFWPSGVPTLLLMLGGAFLLWKQWPASREARVSAFLTLPVALLAMPLAALTGQVGFPRNYGVAAAIFVPLQFWGAWGALRWLEARLARGGDAGRRKIWSGRPALAVLCVAVLAGGAWNFIHNFDFGFRPDRAIRFVGSKMSGSALAIYGEAADPGALDYYARVYELGGQVRFYRYVERAARRSMANLFIIATSDAELEAILREWGLWEQKAGVERLEQLGRYRIYHYQVPPGLRRSAIRN